MFTVIVPFKNAAPWIRRCAESLRQLDGDIECHCELDGSFIGYVQCMEYRCEQWEGESK